MVDVLYKEGYRWASECFWLRRLGKFGLPRGGVARAGGEAPASLSPLPLPILSHLTFCSHTLMFLWYGMASSASSA